MSFTNLLRKAGHLIGLGTSPSPTLLPPALDGEIVYCKNNVCVYPPSARGLNTHAVPGYLTVRSQDDEFVGSTLVLTWVPNEHLKGNPRSVENTPKSSVQVTPRKKQEFATSGTSTGQTSGRNETESVATGSVQDNHASGEFSQSFGKSTFYVNDMLNVDSKENLAYGNDKTLDIGDGQAGGDSVRNDSKRLASETISVEMEGDNLVITTEEFVSENGISSEVATPTSEQLTDADSLSLDSPFETPHKNLPEDSADNLHDTSGEQTADGPLKNGANIRQSTDLKLNLVRVQPTDNQPKIEITRSSRESLSSGSTSGPDSLPSSPIMSPQTPISSASTPGDLSERTAIMRGNPEAVAMKHNLMFPDEAFQEPGSRKSRSKMNCGVFSVDLSQMRSLRLFYSDEDCTSGQFVIASCESQYKILHFHHGGLDKLAGLLGQWDLFKTATDKNKEESNCKYFSVIRPEITNEDCHPEEGIYDQLSEEVWRRHMNEKGIINDSFQLKKAIFFGGLRPELRCEVWPFLLRYYPFESTFEDRERIRNDKYIEYQNVRKLRENMSEEEQELFWRNIQCTVEKDVVRTDRSNPYFSGEDNPNIEILKHILLNYACAHPHYGYNQGMSDLLAPILCELGHEADAYWCFEGLMQKTIFISSPKDCDMDIQLLYLQELLRLMHPRFFTHLKKIEDGMELLFCHRWILLCFKREFTEYEAFQMWEACWAHFQTDYFHLFLCLAIIIIYGEDVIQQQLPADEMLLHFSSLAMHMNGKLVLRKARGLLHQFRLLPTIPCTLCNLTTFCSHGMWDSGHVPKIQCTGPECTTGNCMYDNCPATSLTD